MTVSPIKLCLPGTELELPTGWPLEERNGQSTWQSLTLVQEMEGGDVEGGKEEEREGRMRERES